MADKLWQPPVRYFMAGHHSVNSRSYRCDCRGSRGQTRRLLIKRTIRGQGVLYAGSRRIELSPGWIFMIDRPGDFVYCYEGEGEEWEFEYVSLVLPDSGDWLPEELKFQPAWDAAEQSEITKPMHKLIEKILGRGDKAGSAHTAGYNPNLEGEVMQESAEAYRLYLSCIAARINNPLSQTAAHRLREYLQDNFLSEIQLAEVCAGFDYTPEALSRLFHKNFGMPPLKYLTELRLEKARQLLQQPEKSIKEIAAVCGLGSANYLCRVFKKRFGVTPGQYRKNPDPLLGLQ